MLQCNSRDSFDEMYVLVLRTWAPRPQLPVQARTVIARLCRIGRRSQGRVWLTREGSLISSNDEVASRPIATPSHTNVWFTGGRASRLPVVPKFVDRPALLGTPTRQSHRRQIPNPQLARNTNEPGNRPCAPSKPSYNPRVSLRQRIWLFSPVGCFREPASTAPEKAPRRGERHSETHRQSRLARTVETLHRTPLPGESTGLSRQQHRRGGRMPARVDEGSGNCKPGHSSKRRVDRFLRRCK